MSKNVSTAQWLLFRLRTDLLSGYTSPASPSPIIQTIPVEHARSCDAPPPAPAPSARCRPPHGRGSGARASTGPSSLEGGVAGHGRVGRMRDGLVWDASWVVAGWCRMPRLNCAATSLEVEI